MGDDVEVEDIELGDDKDLAADVDDGIPEEDEDDLESDDDDEDGVFKGIDMEADTDGKLSEYVCSRQQVLIPFFSQSLCISYHFTLYYRQRNK